MTAILTLLNQRTSPSWTFENGQEISVGAASECEVYVPGPLIAPEHFRLLHSGYYCRLLAMDKLIAVCVNGFKKSTVRNNDIISVGYLEFGITITADSSSPAERIDDPSYEFDPYASLVRVGEQLLVREPVHAVEFI